MLLKVNLGDQLLQVFEGQTCLQEYKVSTAKNGAGEQFGSEQTPRGLHMIRAKIGADALINSVFVGRRPTGEIYSSDLKQAHPNRDWILTRILWLSGLEPGKNRLGQVDTMRRFVYIHGTPDDNPMGEPHSRGCVRMRNTEIIELFKNVPVGTQILIEDN